LSSSGALELCCEFKNPIFSVQLIISRYLSCRLPAIASYWSSWTLVYSAISFPTVILIFLYPLIPNSPRWLIKKNRIQEAKEVLLEAARVNGKTDFTEADLEKQLQIQAAAVLEQPPEPSYWEMWRGPGVAKNLICVHLSWSVYIVIYYGFLLNIRNFGKEYLEENTIICGELSKLKTYESMIETYDLLSRNLRDCRNIHWPLVHTERTKEMVLLKHDQHNCVIHLAVLPFHSRRQ
jgi:hypothetical protein